MASHVFLHRGLEGIGMRDVMKAADLTAGGFYRHFSSRDQLIAEAIRAAFDRLFAMFVRVTSGMSPDQSLEQIVSLYLEQSQGQPGNVGEPYLCPLAQLGSELANASPAVRSVAWEGHQRFRALLAGCLANLPHQDAAACASNIVTVLIGAVISADLAPDSHASAAALAHARRAIKAIVSDYPGDQPKPQGT